MIPGRGKKEPPAGFSRERFFFCQRERAGGYKVPATQEPRAEREESGGDTARSASLSLSLSLCWECAAGLPMANSGGGVDHHSRGGNNNKAASGVEAATSRAMARAHSSRKAEGSAAATVRSSGGSGPSSRAGTAAAMAAAAAPTPPALSPRFLSAESRLAQEKAWLADSLPQHCLAEPIRGSDFVWSFKVAGLHRTLYQVGRVLVSAGVGARSVLAPRAAGSVIVEAAQDGRRTEGPGRAGGRAKKKRANNLASFSMKKLGSVVFFVAWMVCWSVSSCLFLTLAYICLCSRAHRKPVISLLLN